MQSNPLCERLEPGGALDRSCRRCYETDG